MRNFRLFLLSGVLLVSCSVPVSDPSEPSPETDRSGQAEPALRMATKTAFFGDLHVHTQNSFDAYIFNVRRTPDDAYRFAKGETIRHDAGFDIQLKGPPLDFLAVTDHGEYLGVIPFMDKPDHPLSRTLTAQAAFGDNRAESAQTFRNIGASFVTGNPIEDINDQSHMNRIWAETLAAAERHNQPGRFTSFAGYEFTAMTVLNADQGIAANLHRNVIFEDTAPERIFSNLDSTNPEDLWAWMNRQRRAGHESLAIPHNSNASNGQMFALETYTGAPLSEAYALNRLANEPLVEITQIKGTSETHPSLSPNDEWADFEQYEYLVGSAVKSTPETGSYIRPALARGLDLKSSLGENPYAFGLIGSSDTHIAAATLREDTHWGKFALDGYPAQRLSVLPEGTERWSELPSVTSDRVQNRIQYSASGLIGVWAEANTRQDLFAAMKARETFGTSGPRLKLRLFAGPFDETHLKAPDLLEQAYALGVPMGGQIDVPEVPPAFLAWAVQDPLSAPLQRLQMVKVWAEQGEAREMVYDIACSGEVQPDRVTHRCPDNGASVDIRSCETDKGSGVAELKTLWRDPEPTDQPAAYYLRVLENPTCRWSTWDAVRAASPPNPEVAPTLQERAWSSPIFVN